MYSFKLFCQIAILSTIFDISVEECLAKETAGERDILICDHYCRYERRIVPYTFKCLTTNIDEISHFTSNYDQYNNIIYAIYSNIPILKLNAYDWPRTTELYFQYTKTYEIVPKFFNNFDELEVLEISHGELKEIKSDTFSFCKKLLKLNLSSNYIESLAAHSFSSLLELNLLDLSNNNLSTISNEVFQNQKHLQHVNISQNHLKHIGNIFSYNVLLQTINLSKNQLTNFNFSDIEGKNLDTLDLSENLLENVIGLSAVHINNVSLSQNKIQSLDNIGNFIKFNISHNFMKIINKTFFSFNVEIVDLSNNEITEISPSTFKNATNLQYLYLDHNQLKFIAPECFIQLKHLIVLDLSSNAISEIPFGLFNNLKSLTYLDLSENNMLLDFHTLTTLKSLQVLKFYNNKVKNFDPDVLVNRFRDLSFVSLGDNMWNCSDLANITDLFESQNISIAKGSNHGTNNIFGISCQVMTDLKEEVITFERNNQKNLQFNNNNKELSIQTFLDTDFKNTTFYKFFLNFSQQFPLQKNSYLDREYSDVSKNAFFQYLNENFTRSNFYKYLESVKSLYSNISNTKNNQQSLNNNLTSLKIQLPDNFTQLNENIQELSVIQNKVSENIKNSLDIQNATLNQLLNIVNSFKSKSTEKQFEQQALIDKTSKIEDISYERNLVVTNILLGLIFCSILSLNYYIIFWKLRRNKLTTDNEIGEQVQLM